MNILNLSSNVKTIQGCYALQEKDINEVTTLLNLSDVSMVTVEILTQVAQKLASIALMNNSTPAATNDRRAVLILNCHPLLIRFLEEALLAIGLAPVYFVNGNFFKPLYEGNVQAVQYEQVVEEVDLNEEIVEIDEELGF